MTPNQHRLTSFSAAPIALALVSPYSITTFPINMFTYVKSFLQNHGSDYAYYIPDIKWAYFIVIFFAFLGSWYGVTAPDWMEIARVEQKDTYKGTIWIRKSVIPHRTITHWWFFWVASLAFLIYILKLQRIDDLLNYIGVSNGHLTAEAILSMMYGFVIGGLLHLLGDVVNPSGIPWLSPLGPNLSFKLWHSNNDVAGTLFACLIILSSWFIIWKLIA